MQWDIMRDAGNVKSDLKRCYYIYSEKSRLNISLKVFQLELMIISVVIYIYLHNIDNALKQYRGFNNFVRTKNIPKCDYYLPIQNFIIEFDESQHFTIPRAIALKLYPPELTTGFDKARWINLCERIRATDKDPPFRDEQRAWYDTLRDFLPLIKGMEPTIRVFAKDIKWCDLSPLNVNDVNRFVDILTQYK